ncbi:MAG: metal-dependent hydrolase [Granulosicoccus sp.]
MDSISQIVLGASIAQLTLGERLGRRALVAGALLGTLPDLDVVVPYADDVSSFTYHRSWSHSLLVLSLVSLPIAWFVQRLFRTTGISWRHCLTGVWLVLITHPLLDSFTTYGTQIFWPLTPAPTALGSVFIIDPLYTVPLIIALIAAWRRPYEKSRTIVSSALALSTAYLAWTLLAQHQVQQKLDNTIAQLGIPARQTMVAPFPLSLLWRTVIETEDHYYEGYSSLLDSASTIELSRYGNGKNLCRQWLDYWPVQRLNWFTQGLFALSIENDQLIASDLRIGVAGSYIFRFAIAEQEDQQWQAIQSRQLPVDVDTQRMGLLLNRATDESVVLLPVTSAGVPSQPTCPDTV